MALSGSLNFLSASLTGSENINVDFVGLNTLIIDPVTASSNELGQDVHEGANLYYNSAIQSIADVDPKNRPVGSGSAGALNSLLLNRNGPYHHPSWKQIRGGQHPVARRLRLNNTMSVDSRHPSPNITHMWNQHVKQYNDKLIPQTSLFHGNHVYDSSGSPISSSSEFEGVSKLLHHIHHMPVTGAFGIPNLKHTYEPSVVSKYNPFVFKTTFDTPIGQQTGIARMTLMNQMTYFADEKMNALLRIAGPNPTTGSTENVAFFKGGQEMYELFHAARFHGSEQHIFSERLYPRLLNTYRPHILSKPNYEEEAGVEPNGFDRTENRSFWRRSQSDAAPARYVTSSHAYASPPGITSYAGVYDDGAVTASTTGLTRTRTNALAKNSQGFVQDTELNPFNSGAGAARPYESHNWTYRPVYVTGSTDGQGGAASVTTGGLTAEDWHDHIGYVTNGIIVTPKNTLTGSFITGAGGHLDPFSGSAAYVNLQAYQPYQLSLLSMWPLDVREDIFKNHVSDQAISYDEPARWLTSSLGGQGRQIGLTPHGISILSTDRSNPNVASYYNVLAVDGLVHFTSASTNTGSDSFMTHHHRVTGQDYGAGSGFDRIFSHAFTTGTAGELAYSTKPTIFYYNGASSGPDVSQSINHDTSGNYFTGSRQDPAEGYRDAIASLQYMRHTYPYNLPFYATNKIIGRDPFYNSYADFIGDEIKYLARDYTILPEFTISDNYDYYGKFFVDYEAKSAVNDGNIYQFFAAVPGLTIALDPDISKKKLGIKRALAVPFPGGPLAFHKLNFLHLHGAGTVTASAGTASLLTTGADLSNVTYDWDEIHGTQKRIKANKDWHYTSDPSAVTFYKKYSHTDDMTNFCHLTNQAKKGFINDVHTVPKAITFVCNGLKKLLPHDGFYPVTRTIQIGSYLSGAFGDKLREDHSFINANYSKPSYLKPTKAAALAVDSDRRTIGLTSDGLPLGQGSSSWEAAVLQSFLEPLMAPGVLYNSIRSGIAVDHPVYTTNPKYFAPPDLTGSAASMSFGYGGFYMMGASRCTPSILTSKPDSRLPFEAIYRPEDLRFLQKQVLSTGAGTITTLVPRSNHLISDFVDIMRAGTASLGHYATMSYAPKAFAPGDGKKISTAAHQKYRASINNYLAETMRFFLDDQTTKGVKFPIFLSDKKSVLNVFTDATYYLDLSLEMGKNHVMSEGPRQGGFVNGLAGFQQSSSIRGYIYGPPIEIYPFSGSTTVINDRFESAGTIGSQDLDHYYAANLQDPAYQAYTPPYFYGDSHVYLSYKAFGDDSGLDSPNLAKQQIQFPTLFDRVIKDSFYYEEYHTTASIDGSSLTPYCLPSTGSVSNASNVRMKIDSSVGIFDEFVAIQSEGEKEYVWAITPKWVCPVLDFSSSICGVEETTRYVFNQRLKKHTFVTNSFHTDKTGRGMWGGYGTDPYDSETMAQMYANEPNPNFNYSTMGDEKGIYFRIGEAFQPKFANDVPNQVGFLQDKDPAADGFFSNVSGYAQGGVTESGSLGKKLGFLKPNESEKKFQLGRMANGKNISEAVAIIPYFEQPLRIRLDKAGTLAAHTDPALPGGFVDPGLFATKEDVAEFLDGIEIPGDEIYETRHIIPGKHFLPVHKKVFENTLSTVLVHKFYNEQDSVWKNLHGTSKQTLQTAKASDCGRMIDLLLGDEATGRSGYQLPPEFDFMNNAAVSPFQIMILPFNHSLDKQDLINIYQGVMPDISLRAEKVQSTFTAHPDLFVSNKDLVPSVTYVPIDEIVSSNSEDPGNNESMLATERTMSPLKLFNFLNPFAAVGNNAKNTLFPNGVPGGFMFDNGVKDAREFYRHLKFMVFKIKQKAVSDYDVFRQRQILQAIRNKFDGVSDKNIIMDGQEILTNVRATEVYGPNWPYDYFSLIEAAKIDIEIEVDV